MEFYAVADRDHRFDFVEDGGVVVRGLLSVCRGAMRGDEEDGRDHCERDERDAKTTSDQFGAPEVLGAEFCDAAVLCESVPLAGITLIATLDGYFGER